MAQVGATGFAAPFIYANIQEKKDDGESTGGLTAALAFMGLWSVVAAAGFLWYKQRHVVQVSYSVAHKRLRFHMFSLLGRGSAREAALSDVTLHRPAKEMSYLYFTTRQGSHFLVERSGKVTGC